MTASFEFSKDKVGSICLVTGGSGYVGGHLIWRLLELGCEVRSVDIVPYKGDSRVISHVGDIRDYEFLKKSCVGVDTVFHAAALINLLAMYRPSVRRRVFGVNVHGTENVIRACQENGVTKLIYTASIAVVGGADQKLRDETAPYASKEGLYDLYAETKGIGEQKTLEANDGAGLQTASVRPGGVWGPGEGAIMVQQFVKDLAAGRFVAKLGNGKAEIDNTHVDNLVDAQFLIAEKLCEPNSEVGGQAYFITDDEPINGIDWYRPMVEALGYKWPKMRIPTAIAYRMGHLAEIRHFFGAPEPMMTRRTIESLSIQNSFSIDKARKHLGYEPRIQVSNGVEPMLPGLRLQIEAMKAKKAG